MSDIKLNTKTKAVVLDILNPLAKEMERCYAIVKDDPQKLEAWLAMRLVSMIDTLPDTVEVVEGKVMVPAYTKLDVMRLLAQVNKDLMANKVARDRLLGNVGKNPALGGFISDLRGSNAKLPPAMLGTGNKAEA